MTNGSATSGLAQEIRSLSATLREMKNEASRFVQTRIRLLKSEVQEKLPNLKIAAALGLVGALFLAMAYLLFTLALVALAAILFRDSDYRWVFALLSVGLLWCALAGVALYFAKCELSVEGMIPKRTLDVLRADKIWLEKEAG